MSAWSNISQLSPLFDQGYNYEEFIVPSLVVDRKEMFAFKWIYHNSQFDP